MTRRYSPKPIHVWISRKIQGRIRLLGRFKFKCLFKFRLKGAAPRHSTFGGSGVSFRLFHVQHCTARRPRDERRRRFQRRRIFAQGAGLRCRRRHHEGLAAGLHLARRGQMLRPGAIADARGVAHALGIPHYVVDESDQFEKLVIDYFAAEYQAGRTPNPCVMCNEKLKFGNLWDKARSLGAEYIATGHYAIIEHHAGRRRAAQGPRPAQGPVLFLFSACARSNCSAPSARSARCPSRRFAISPGKSASRSPKRWIARKSASCPATTTRRS